MRDISLHILDIMQNSTAARAGLIRVTILVHSDTGLLEIEIADNGCGMESDLLARVTDPFTTTRTTRKVGLGIPLFMASSEQSGGSFSIVSKKDAGTTLTATFQINHIDRPPLGDLAGVITDMAAAWPAVEIQLILGCGDNKFEFNSSEVSRMLGEVPLTEFTVILWLREYIGEGLKEIFGGVLSEIVS